MTIEQDKTSNNLEEKINLSIEQQKELAALYCEIKDGFQSLFMTADERVKALFNLTKSGKPKAVPSGFVLGVQSLKNLEGVHLSLTNVVKMAINLSKADFTVFEGLRTESKQREYVSKGVSWTMKSKHLTGHAVDLVPYVSGQPRWDWPLCYLIADAVRDTAVETGVTITWGGVWDTPLNELDGDLEEEVANYVKRQLARGKKARTDGPHFEIDPNDYPFGEVS